MNEESRHSGDNIRVFYYTGSIPTREDRGSAVRIVNILSALQSIHPDLRVIAGPVSVRQDKIRALKRDVRNGAKVEFLYAENTNLPVILESRRPNPLSFFQHVLFLNWVRRSRIPIGYFYRDIRWRFPFFTSILHGPLAHLLKPLNWIDWYIIDRASNILYLPSQEMNNWLPRPRKKGTYRGLPPGFNQERCLPGSDESHDNHLQLVYVGGLNKPVYSFTRALKAIYNHDFIQLTLCCRESEWDSAKDELGAYIGHNVNVVHLSDDALSAVYRNADIFLLAMDPCEYWAFSFPVKFAESIGYGVPVVCCKHQTAIASVIRKDRIGWILDNPEDLTELAKSARLRDEILEFKNNMAKIREQHSWQSRANMISNDLSAEAKDA